MQGGWDILRDDMGGTTTDTADTAMPTAGSHLPEGALMKTGGGVPDGSGDDGNRVHGDQLGDGAPFRANDTAEDEACEQWVNLAENMLVDIGSLGEDRAKFVGRARGPRTVWRCPLGQVGSCDSHVSPTARAWACLAKWLHAIHLALNAHRRPAMVPCF